MDRSELADLRRRVLLTGMVAIVLFFAVAYAVASAGLADWWVLVGVAVAYVLIIRPMMRPVREVTKLRRSLAYQAFLEQKQKDEP
ncbi:MAG: hypothetical protein QOI82_881 [Actinomycetota bacterium]|jgi:small-conductance mechanosensitive channel|nr:hypothetical protein [Actinomycetota bacterium]